jgi:hypothetical protein
VKIRPKFVIAVLALLCLTVVCALGRVDGLQFVGALSLIVGMYNHANLKEREAELKAGAPAKADTDAS